MGRAPCCDKANVKRGPWSPDEDATLKRYVETHGTGGNWIVLPQKAGLRRCGKSCRLRWLNYLRPDIKHGGFTEEEDDIIYNLYNQMGSRWSLIASQLPGRTDNDVKNYWNTKLKKKLSGSSGKSNLTINPPSTHNSLPCLPINPDQAYNISFSDPWQLTQNQNYTMSSSLTSIGYGLAQSYSLDPVLPHSSMMFMSDFGSKSSSHSAESSSNNISDSSAACLASLPGDATDTGILMDFGVGFTYYDGFAYDDEIKPQGLVNQSVVNQD